MRRCLHVKTTDVYDTDCLSSEELKEQISYALAELGDHADAFAGREIGHGTRVCQHDFWQEHFKVVAPRLLRPSRG